MTWFADEAISQNIKISDVYTDAAPKSGRVLGIGVEWLKRASRYRIDIPLIPHGREERKIATLGRYSHGLIMPSKFVAIEYEHGGAYEMDGDLTRALSTKRIALCVDLESEDGVEVSGIPGFVRRETDHGGILVWPLSYFDEKRDWEFSPGAAIIPRYQARDYLNAPKKSAFENILTVSARFLGLREPEDPSMQVFYQDMLPELCAKLGEEHKDYAIRETALDAVWVALGFFSALTCKNVEINSETHSAFMLDSLSGKTISKPLDPFHGKREVAWDGTPRWDQGLASAPVA